MTAVATNFALSVLMLMAGSTIALDIGAALIDWPGITPSGNS